MMKKALCLVVMITLMLPYTYGCDMSALILKSGTIMADFANQLTTNQFNDYELPQDYLAFVMSRSGQSINNDGYGIVYYPRNKRLLGKDNYRYKYVHSAAELNRVWYTGNYFNSTNPPDIFDTALQEIMQPETDASIVMSHARNATANPFAPGNHPFRMDINNRTYSFMHNGFVSTATRTFMINEVNALYPSWLTDNEPNFGNFANSTMPAYWIDSEVLFNYLMCHIALADFDVYTGLRLSLAKLTDFLMLSTNVVNFILSDGQHLFAFRSTSVSGVNSGYKLSYQHNSKGFTAIRTGYPAVNETQIGQFELIMCDNLGRIEKYPDFLNPLQSYARNGSQSSVSHHRAVGTVVNPQHTGIDISFNLTAPSRVVINIYNGRGRFVRNLKDEYLQTGFYKVNWNGRNRIGAESAKGMYLIELMALGERKLIKAAYLR